MDKDIKYINRDFSDFRQRLIEYTKTYFPNTYNDFSPSSPGMMFMEQAAYVGDVLSFYLDNQIQENFTQYAQQNNNIYELAYMFGYKPKTTTAAQTTIDFYQQIPAKSVEIEVVREAKTSAREPVIEQSAPAQNNAVVQTREPSACEIAREALNTVGLDPIAEKVWLDTINNLENPAKERKNLIEDLDTTGFKSHRNPTSDDVALIQSRLALIEKYAPGAADPVNAAAFQEAKKDLTRMLAKATAQIQPATQPTAPVQPASPIQ